MIGNLLNWEETEATRLKDQWTKVLTKAGRSPEAELSRPGITSSRKNRFYTKSCHYLPFIFPEAFPDSFHFVSVITWFRSSPCGLSILAIPEPQWALSIRQFVRLSAEWTGTRYGVWRGDPDMDVNLILGSDARSVEGLMAGGWSFIPRPNVNALCIFVT